MRPSSVKPSRSVYLRASQPRSLRLQWWQWLGVFGLGFACWHLLAVPKPPQALLVLGGSPERERFAAEFALDHPGLPIWVSSGSNPEYAELVFSQAGINPERIHLDYQAVDTVTNFTTLVQTLQAKRIDSIYLLTSDYHMERAEMVGQIILGSRGIDFQPVLIPSHTSPDVPESLEKTLRDGARAVLWVLTGSTGAMIGQTFPSQTGHFLVDHLKSE